MFDGFTYSQIQSSLLAKGINFSYGETIKPHTIKKINYVSKYVKEWLYVVSNVSDEIFFVDVMCNAGLYKNDYLSTAVCVLNLFIKQAQRFTTKKFYLLCNDYDPQKVNTMKEIFSLYLYEMKKNEIENVCFQIESNDASEYIKNLNINYLLRHTRGKKRSVVLYVDPYNFITNELANSMLNFSSKVYCEIIFNFFCNDYIRNINNPKTVKKRDEIIKTLTLFCGVQNLTTDAKLVLKKFIDRFKTETYMKYSYSVRMKNANNAPLYDLVFFTPNIRGLEKVKEATWNTFSFHDDFSYTMNDNMDPNLFGETDEDIAFDMAREKICKLLSMIGKNEFSYDELEEIVLQDTFLKKGQLIEKLIKPLIAKGKFVKKGLSKSFNFTKDNYIFERN